MHRATRSGGGSTVAGGLDWPRIRPVSARPTIEGVSPLEAAAGLPSDVLPAPLAIGPKRLLVIGASTMRAAAFATWRAMGIEIVLVDGHSTARYEDLVNEFWPLDARDPSANLARIREIARGCDGITTLADDSQATVAKVAEELGLVGVGREAGAVARSKALQRSLCEAAGMAVPRWREVRQVDDLRDFFADGPRPAVIKPVDGAGGVGALRVGDLTEAARHWPVVRTLSPARAAVIEDYIEGREVCVEAVVADGRPAFVSITETDNLASIGFVCVSAKWATHQADRDMGRRMVEQLVGAIGFRDGLVHAEFKIQDDSTWVMLETGLRPGGAYVSELTVRVTGVDLYESQARLALGERPVVLPPRPPVAPYAQARYLVGEGRVRRFVPSATVLANLPDVRVVVQQAGPGQHVRIPLSDAGRGGYALGWGMDRDALDAQLRQAVTALAAGMGLTPLGLDADGNDLAA